MLSKMTDAPARHMFVNHFQGSTTLSTTEGAEAYSIGRVVQYSCQLQTQRQKRRKLDHLKSNSASPIGRFAWTHQDVAPATDVSTVKEEVKEEDADDRLIVARQCPEPARSLSSISNNDLSFDSQSMHMLHVYIQSWEQRPEAYQQFFGLGLSGSVLESVEASCGSKETHALAVMAYSANLYQRLQVVPVSKVQAERLLQKALQGLRSSLSASDADAESIIFDSAYLSLLEAHRGERHAAVVHLSAINRLLPAAGGISRVPNFLSGMFLFADYFVAMQNLERPVLEERFQQNTRLPAPVRPISSGLGQAGHEVLQSTWMARLSVGLRRIVCGLVRCIQVLEHAWSDPKAAINGFWARKECMITISQLLIIRDSTTSPKSESVKERGRKFHHKSRDGCETCRKRHVKCDEAKPACHACTSRGMMCGGYNRPKPKIFEPTWNANPSTTSPQSEEGSITSEPEAAGAPDQRLNATILVFWTAIVLATTHDLGGARHCLPKISPTLIESCEDLRAWNDALSADVKDVDDFMRRLFATVSRAEKTSSVRLESLVWQFLLEERFYRTRHAVEDAKAIAGNRGHWWSSSVLLR